MIERTFDAGSPPMITPQMIYGDQRNIIKTCIVTFSHTLFEQALHALPCTKIAGINACNGAIPIYSFTRDGKQIGFYLSPLGSTMAANCVIEVNWLTGADSFIMFGSAGCLDRAATAGKLVIPTEAYRDEGMSYHYLPAADYISVPGSKKVAEVFDSLRVPYVTGRVWTTDAMYRETHNAVRLRKADGCLAVEMELAGVQAVCAHHGLSLYDFLMIGDVLDLPEWSCADLAKANHYPDNFALSVELALKV